MTDHPHFTAAKAHRHWTGTLPDLISTLRHEAYEIGAGANEAMRDADRDFAWRILRGGVVVCLRVRGDLGGMRRELRICRSEPLREDAAQKWELEVGTFLRLFSMKELDGSTPAHERSTCYVRTPNTAHDDGKTVVRFIELLVGEILPEAARCHRCHMAGRFEVVPYRSADAIVGQHCPDHAEFSLDDRERAKAQV